MLGLITWYPRESMCGTWAVCCPAASHLMGLHACLFLHWSVSSVQNMSEVGGKSPCVLFLWVSLFSFSVKFLQMMHLWCSLPPPHFFHDLPSSWPWTFYLLSPPPPLLSSPVCDPWRADPCAVPQLSWLCLWWLLPLVSWLLSYLSGLSDFPICSFFSHSFDIPLCPGLISLRE